MMREHGNQLEPAALWDMAIAAAPTSDLGSRTPRDLLSLRIALGRTDWMRTHPYTSHETVFCKAAVGNSDRAPAQNKVCATPPTSNRARGRRPNRRNTDPFHDVGTSTCHLSVLPTSVLDRRSVEHIN
jgi:hypothetical protein